MTFQKLTQEQYAELKENRINEILETFKKLEPQDLVKYTVKSYVEKIGAPCENWSLFNKILTKLAGTSDGRTYKNWQKVGRKIKAGSKAFYIWRPVSKMVKEYDPKFFDQELEKEHHYQIRYLKMDAELTRYQLQIGIQFGLCPEFKIEDTEGEPIHYENEPKKYPPLMNVAKKLGIKVSWSKFDNQELGYYQPATKKIVLKAYDFETFFHELTHGIHDHLEKLKGGQDVNQETIAEFTACVIASIYGIDVTKKTLTYITHYSGNKEQAMKNIDKNIHTVEKILDFVFTVENPKKKVTKKVKPKK